MTYVSTHHFASDCQDTPSNGRVKSTIANLIYSIGDLLRSFNRRRLLTTFRRMSDQQLLDIGLLRDDIFEAKTLGYHKDVTRHLAKIARRRRQNFARSAVRNCR